jgi:Rrf2 family protein
MVSQTAEYALRAVVFLAGQKKVPRTTAQIAQATQIPAGYLAKVMQSLSRGGVVRSQRGLNGGFVLARPATETSLLEVINAVDPLRRYPECPLGLAEHGAHLCPLHTRLDDAARLVEDAFRRTSLAELLSGPRSAEQPCRFPADSLPEA